ncbi:MAG: T9SS type A sorting domain-containing protein [Melioribacteraceae bacterium]|nr:T9SS type A sorting domain-containing protein [Melioribacteraceae bacterium]MCF8264086.1 T9SS type A sorting domain-containing protein [Melioribacteraceae bacterium]MCF8414591.1 T9SS type A sorting domain-containing protein [Melioribacteraceae bacterium]MCF8431909.1 T9SS type A sorting domain-containing protein [Melioribacteraceae bacterium]
METVKFVANSIKGSAANPFILRAGRLIVDIDSNSEVSIARLDTAWYGTEDIQFWVEENTVKKLSDTTSTFLQVLENVLPVELNSFTGRVINNKVELNWETITELNNYGFWVERKLETADWAKLGFIEGVGNSNSPKLYKFIDSSPIAGKAYYRLKQIDFDGKFEYSSIIEVNVASPTKFELLQNYPNPFNPTTTIKFTIPASVMLNSFQHLENKTPKPASSADKQDRGDNLLTTLNVYNALGEKVAELVNEQKPAGTYEVTFNAENLSSGTYFYQLRAGELVQTKKLILIK